MYGLHPLDIAAVVLYLAGITGLGVWMARKVRNTGDFFMPRRFGKTMMVTFAFGAGTASDQAVSVAAETFRSGLSGIWWQWLWLPATPFYWLIAPIMRRFRAVTTADVYTLRYNHSVAVLFAIVGIAGLAVKIGLLLKGSGVLIDSCTAGMIPARWASAILTVLFSFMLLPFVLQAAGGMHGIRETIRNPDMLSLVVPGEIGIFFVAMFAAQALIGIVAQPFILGVCAAGRTEMDGRVGFMVGNVIKRICTIAWSLTALAAVAWYMQRGTPLSEITPDHVYGDVAREFLPAVMPGLLGIFLASLIASVMSSCDAMMVSSSALFTENMYKPLLPGRSDGHYVLVGRLAAVGALAGSIAFWLGLFWRRATPAGAWAVTVTGFAMPKERLDRFYTLTRTPIVPGERVTESCRLPEGVEPARRPMLVTAFGLEIPVPSRTSVLGFLAGWLAVALLVGGFLLIIRTGHRL